MIDENIKNAKERLCPHLPESYIHDDEFGPKCIAEDCMAWEPKYEMEEVQKESGLLVKEKVYIGGYCTKK